MNLPKTPLHFLYKDEYNNNLFIKREDLLPFSFGGNKARISLEFMKDMEEKACNHMIAYGGPQSNLCRVISNLCAQKNIPCTIVSLLEEGLDPNLFSNYKMAKAFGAEYVYCTRENVAETIKTVMENLTEKGYKPYYINGNSKGRGNEHVPVAAYAKVYKEITEQEIELKQNFDKIFLACGTGMTISGLVCGKILNKSKHDIVGISISRQKTNALPYISKYIESYLYKRSNSIFDDALYNENVYNYVDDYCLSYGKSNCDIDALIKYFLVKHGIALDTTYTGKAMYGMTCYIKKNNIQDSNLLFIHTGGTPLFFDDLNRLLKEE
ncbi:MAG: pyridoxal-phosphate dependent enzyme [Christensenellaceae bacterium]|nr:pyridoxal-phosphate dependent enzyme [Christensenellaceae bacterium]